MLTLNIIQYIFYKFDEIKDVYAFSAASKLHRRAFKRDLENILLSFGVQSKIFYYFDIPTESIFNCSRITDWIIKYNAVNIACKYLNCEPSDNPIALIKERQEGKILDEIDNVHTLLAYVDTYQQSNIIVKILKKVTDIDIIYQALPQLDSKVIPGFYLFAAKNNNIELISEIFNIHCYILTSTTLSKYLTVEIIEWFLINRNNDFHKLYPPVITWPLLECLIDHGKIIDTIIRCSSYLDLKSAEYLIKINKKIPDRFLYNAIINGHIDIVKCLAGAVIDFQRQKDIQLVAAFAQKSKSYYNRIYSIIGHLF